MRNLQREAASIIKELTGQARQLTVQRLYVDFMGGLERGLFLSQLLYWSGRAGEDGWFYKTFDEWQEEICLTEYTVRKSIEQCKKFGFLKTKVKKANGNPTVHYKIDDSIFIEVLSIFIIESVKTQEGILEDTDSMESLKSSEPLTYSTIEYIQAAPSEADEPSPPDEQPRDKNGKVLTPPQIMVKALAEITKFDVDREGERLGKIARAIMKKKYTVDQVRQAGEAWYLYDFRGRNDGKIPNPEELEKALPTLLAMVANPPEKHDGSMAYNF